MFDSVSFDLEYDNRPCRLPTNWRSLGELHHCTFLKHVRRLDLYIFFDGTGAYANRDDSTPPALRVIEELLSMTGHAVRSGLTVSQMTIGADTRERANGVLELLMHRGVRCDRETRLEPSCARHADKNVLERFTRHVEGGVVVETDESSGEDTDEDSV